MNTTTIPGFSAEASLYRGFARYPTAPRADVSRGEEGMIHPAWMRGWCQQLTDDGHWICCVAVEGQGMNCATF
jgi:hypothetical protein